jgi:hypothetical protein
MKRSMISNSLLLGLALLLATSAFAANKGSLQVGEPVSVSGKTLPAGEYSVKWEGTGPNVELNILQGGKVIATVPARMIDLQQSPSQDSAVVRKNDDGSRSLSEIRFGGKKYAFSLGAEQAKADAGETTTK